MPIIEELNQEERDFFLLVMDATLANPFSARRLEVDRKITGLFPKTPKDVLFDATIDAVRKKILQFKQSGRADIRLYREPDKTLIRAAFLFDFFHHYSERFDAMILNQVEQRKSDSDTRKSPEKVNFASKALSDLKEKGFSHDDAVHFFSLCFQIRRAYYFIDKNLIGLSSCMTKLRESLWNNVFTSDLDFYSQHMWNRMEDFSTLIIGETGSGKGTAANAIGRSGYIPFDEKKMCFTSDFTRSFLALNISQFPENLIESELFGHKKGSFTGAVDDHAGVFSKCSPHGAIFLDEIGEVSQPIQIKLLKVLEERAFSPVGSRETERFEGRIITATNRSMEELHNPSILRKDFYYRLCTDIIIVPPLRQRISEFPGELDHLLENRILKIIGTKSIPTLGMVKKIIFEKLGRRYGWPGNVRELEQYVRRILLNRQGTIVHDTNELACTDQFSPATSLADPISKGAITAQDLLKAYCYELYSKSGNIGDVARRTQLDRRTVKKYCDQWAEK